MCKTVSLSFEKQAPGTPAQKELCGVGFNDLRCPATQKLLLPVFKRAWLLPLLVAEAGVIHVMLFVSMRIQQLRSKRGFYLDLKECLGDQTRSPERKVHEAVGKKSKVPTKARGARTWHIRGSFRR